MLGQAAFCPGSWISFWIRKGFEYGLGQQRCERSAVVDDRLLKGAWPGMPRMAVSKSVTPYFVTVSECGGKIVVIADVADGRRLAEQAQSNVIRAP